MRARALMFSLLVAVAAIAWQGLGPAWGAETLPALPTREAGAAPDAAGAEVHYWPPRTDARRARDLELWRNLDDCQAALWTTVAALGGDFAPAI